MASQLRCKYDMIINGGGVAGFTLLNLILRSPLLNRSKVLLIEQASKLSNYIQQPKAVFGQSPSYKSPYSTGDVKFFNRVSSITLPSSRLAFIRMGGWNIVRSYSKDSRASFSSDNQGANHSKDKIDKLLKDSKKRVFVFMKGVPSEPACGYSNAVVQILNAYGVEYDSFNVLSDEGVRQEVKAYSNWPTIPQVYVDGSFIGGCDILIQMHQNNELESLFETKENNNNNNNNKDDKKE